MRLRSIQVAALLLVACSDPSQKEVSEYLDFVTANPDLSSQEAAFAALPIDKRVGIFIGAVRHKPPRGGIVEVVQYQDPATFKAIRDRIAERGFQELEVTYFVISAAAGVRRGALTQEQHNELRLQEMCDALGARAEHCRSLL